MTRTLIVAPAWIGDMVMAQSLVAELKARDPTGEVDLIAPPWTAPLGQRMPGVRTSLTMNQAHGRLDLFERIAMGRRLKDRYDFAIVLPRSLKSAVIPLAAAIPERRGYLGEFRYGVLTQPRRLDPSRWPRTVDQFTALAAPQAETTTVRPPTLVADPGSARDLAARLDVPLGRPVIALCPGAEYGPAKQWPAVHFADLGRRLIGAGYDVWIFGSPKEAALGDDIAGLIGDRHGHAITLVGRFSLLESLDLMSLCVGAVSNDSGLMHVASALGLCVVGLYGSTSPGVTPPLGSHVDIAQLELVCRPCFQRTCPLGHLDCLTKLEPAAVFVQLSRLLAGRSVLRDQFSQDVTDPSH